MQQAFKQSGVGTALENYLKVFSTFTYYSLVGGCILLASIWFPLWQSAEFYTEGPNPMLWLWGGQEA